MTLDSVRDRHKVLVENDWRSVAEDVFAEKWQEGDVSHSLYVMGCMTKLGLSTNDSHHSCCNPHGVD